MLSLLLGLEVEPGEPAEVLLADGLVDGRAPTDPLAVVVGDRGPPVRLGLDVAEDDVFDRGRHPGHLPRDVGLPAPPGLRQVLEDRLGLVLLDRFGHHVEDVVHDGRPKLEVKVGLDPLLGNRLGDALGVTALELPGEQVVEPALEQGNDTFLRRRGSRSSQSAFLPPHDDAFKSKEHEGASQHTHPA